jgi:glutamate carboxypeptidase
VVPDEAYALIDFRVTTMEEYRRLEQWAQGLAPRLEGTQVSAEVQLNRPPMPRDETMAAAFQKACEIARALGLELTEGSTGGGSDANFVAPLGLPVLDGLGPVGDGAHSEREFVRVDSLVERSALLAALMLNW